MQLIEKEINPLPTGQRRKVRAEGMQYLSYRLASGEFVWLELLLDQDGEEINHPSIRPRRIVTPIDNNNLVNEDGVLLVIDFIKATTPMNEAESEEDYNKRCEELLALAKESGIPEVSYWIDRINKYGWDATIAYSLDLLASFNRFDKA